LTSGNTEIWVKATKVLFTARRFASVPGAVRRDHQKESALPFQTLLDLFGTPLEPPAVPLFISEGSSPRQTEFDLPFRLSLVCILSIRKHRGPLVVFGQSLSAEFDGHLIDAIRKSEAKILAISLVPGTRDVPTSKARFAIS